MVIGRGLHLDRERLDLLAIAAVDLVEHLAVQLDLDLLRRRRLHERRAFRLTDGRASQRAHPVGDAIGVDDAELEAAVVGACILEHFDAAEEATDVADEDAARRARVPRDAVDFDLRLERLRAKAVATRSTHKRRARGAP